MLFNIFINDIFGDDERIGVSVPTSEGPRPFVPGALFADDAVGLSGDLETVALFCKRISEWTTANEMQVGIKKCGILEILGNGTYYSVIDNLAEDDELRVGLKINGEPVPVVKEYKYLGLVLTHKLGRDEMVSRRLKIGKVTVNQILPYLKCNTISMSMRLRVVQAVVCQRLYYGAEVYGMNRKLTNAMQSLLNKCLRVIIGVHVRANPGSTPSVALWRECGLKPVCAVAAGLRARAFIKCYKLKTAIGELVRRPLRTPHWTWVHGTIKWMATHCEKFLPPQLREGKWKDLVKDPKEMKRVVSEAITGREERNRLKYHHGHSAETARYLAMGFEDKRSLTKGKVFVQPRDNPGLAALLRCRIGAVQMAPALVEAKVIRPMYKLVCPCCKRGGEKEDLYHMIFRCRAFRRQRRKFIRGAIKATRGLERALQRRQELRGSINLGSKEISLSWILGGIHGKLGMRDFFPPRPTLAEANEDPNEDLVLVSPTSSVDEADQEENQVNGVGDQETPHMVAVCRFLAEVLPARAALLADGSVRVASGNTRDFGREVGNAPSPGPGPNG